MVDERPSPESASERERVTRRRWPRRLRWAAAAFCVLLLLAVIALIVVVRSLDHPRVKSVVTRVVGDRIGVGFDYQHLSLSLSGLKAEGLRLATPSPFTEHAPSMLEIDLVDVRVPLASLLARPLTLPRVRVEGVRVALVVDSEGQSSLDLLAGDEPPAPPDPRPSTLTELLSPALPSFRGGSIDIRDVTLNLTRLDMFGEVASVESLEGLELSGRAGTWPEVNGRFVLASPGAVGPGSLPEAMTVVRVTHGRPPFESTREARLVVALSLELARDEQGLSIFEVGARADLHGQDLVSDLPPSGPLLDLAGEVTVSPAEGRTRVVLTRLGLPADLGDAELVADLFDRLGRAPRIEVRRARLALDLDKIPDGLLQLVPGVEFEGGALALAADGLTIDGRLPGLPLLGAPTVSGGLRRLAVSLPGAQLIELRGLGFQFRAQPHDGGTFALEGEIETDELVMNAPGQRLHLRSLSGNFDLTGLPPSEDETPPAGRLSLHTAAGELTAGGDDATGARDLTVAATGASAELRAALDDDGRIAATLRLPLDHALLRVKSGFSVSLDQAFVSLSLSDATWTEFQGELMAEVGAARAALAHPSGRIAAAGLGASVSTVMSGALPTALGGTIPFARLDLAGAAGGPFKPVELYDGLLTWQLDELALDLDHPLRSTGRLELALAFADSPGGAEPLLDARAAISKDPDDATVSLSLSAPDLAFVSRLLSPRRHRSLPVRWRDLGATLTTTAQVSGLGGDAALRFDQRSILALERLAARVGGKRISCPWLRITMNARGTGASINSFDAELQAGRPSVDRRLVAGELNAFARAERRGGRPHYQFGVRGGGGGARLDGVIDLSVGRGGSVDYDLRLEADRLDGLSGLLGGATPPLEHVLVGDDFGVRLAAAGKLEGLVRRIDYGLKPVIAPARSIRPWGDQELTVTLRNLSCLADETTAFSPEISVSANAALSEEGGAGTIRIAHGGVDLAASARRLRLGEGAHELSFEFIGPPSAGRVTLMLATRFGEVAQNIAPFYPPGPLTLNARARLSQWSALRLDELTIDSPTGGSRLELTAALSGGGSAGALEAGEFGSIPGRRALAVAGVLHQQLDSLRRTESGPHGSGRLRVPFRVESGDFTRYRVEATVEADNVDAAVPSAEASVSGLHGAIRVAQELVRAGDGSLSMVVGPAPNVYSRVRFHDLHPFLTGGSFLRADRVRVGPVDIGPLAGNFRMVHNLLALDQIEAGFRDGTVAGQLVVNYLPDDTVVLFRGNATGLRPSRTDERLDANAALVLALDRMELDGRVQVVRIGRQHLRDLLDLFDPYREDVAINRIRMGLALGYPRFARVELDHGFLSAKVELGGAASLLRLDEIRGIPTAALLRRFLAPLLDRGGGTP